MRAVAALTRSMPNSRLLNLLAAVVCVVWTPNTGRTKILKKRHWNSIQSRKTTQTLKYKCLNKSLPLAVSPHTQDSLGAGLMLHPGGEKHRQARVHQPWAIIASSTLQLHHDTAAAAFEAASEARTPRQQATSRYLEPEPNPALIPPRARSCPSAPLPTSSPPPLDDHDTSTSPRHAPRSRPAPVIEHRRRPPPPRMCVSTASSAEGRWQGRPPC